MSKVHRIKCGSVNCFIIENDGKGVLVDTGKREYAERVLEACRKFDIRLIVLTHGHFDHVENAAELSEKLGVPIAMNERDIGLIESNGSQELETDSLLGKIVLYRTLKAFPKRQIPEFRPSVFLGEGDSLNEYGIDARIIELPGHTDGSIGMEVDGNKLIVGDELMNMFYPTTAMVYHNRKDMLTSMIKLLSLRKRRIYFGHGRDIPNSKWLMLY